MARSRFTLTAILCLVIAFLLMLMRPVPAAANDPQKLIDDAASLARSLLTDPEWGDFHAFYPEARAVIVVPDYLKAGFVFGGAGGQGVVIARDPETGAWGSPAFVLMGQASIGFQAGVSKSEYLMLVMNDGTLEKVAGGTVDLGGTAGVAFGLYGSGVKGSTTFNLDRDIIAFSRGQGLFGGMAIDGGWIGPDTDYNHAYYKQPVTAHGILIENAVASPNAERLRNALSDPHGIADRVKMTREYADAPFK